MFIYIHVYIFIVYFINSVVSLIYQKVVFFTIHVIRFIIFKFNSCLFYTLYFSFDISTYLQSLRTLFYALFFILYWIKKIKEFLCYREITKADPAIHKRVKFHPGYSHINAIPVEFFPIIQRNRCWIILKFYFS